jgi:ribonuclease P protein component
MTDASLPRIHRLASRQDFTCCFDQGRRLKFSGGYAVVAKSPCTHSRLGIIVSKKVCAHAVDRNRIRRLHKECFRQDRAKMGYWDVVIVCLRPMDYEEIMKVWQIILPSLNPS